MLTDERLKFIAKQALAMGKTELRVRGDITGIFASYFERQGMHRMRSVEKLIVELAGEDWLSSAFKKERAFGILRYANWIAHPDAVAFVSVINRYDGTPAFKALPHEEMDRVYHECADAPRDHPQWFTPRDALMSSVQTPERLCVSTQLLQGTLLIGEPDVNFWDQAEFGGNLKMFGEPPEWIVEAMKTANAELLETITKWRKKSSSSGV